MKYLLDTHIAMLALAKQEKLPQHIIEVLSDKNNQVYYSSVSIWETGIKHLKKPNQIRVDGKQLASLLDDSGAINVPLKNIHIYELENLVIKNCKFERNDPFDKILLSQAISEYMIFITADKKFMNYECPSLTVL